MQYHPEDASPTTTSIRLNPVLNWEESGGEQLKKVPEAPGVLAGGL
jgi:hypothetical protein